MPRFRVFAAAVLAIAGLFLVSHLPTSAQEKKGDKKKVDGVVDKIMKALPDKAPAAPKQPRKILIYSKTLGFRHGSIAVGIKAISMMGDHTKAYTALATEDESMFEPEKLKVFDAVFMLNTTGDCLRPKAYFVDASGNTISAAGLKEAKVDQKLTVVDAKNKAIEGAKVAKVEGKEVAVDANGKPIPKAKINRSGGRDIVVDANGKEIPGAKKLIDTKREDTLKKSLADFVASGKGLIGVHSATDTYHNWKEYNKMMGGTFSGHPWNAGSKVFIKNLDPKHPLNAAFDGKDFEITDEIYQFRADTALPTERRFLLSLDSSKTNVKIGNRKDGLYPISWVSTHGKGRTFYCSLGHNDHIYWNPMILQHYLAGIQYALGDLVVDTTPINVKAGQ